MAATPTDQPQTAGEGGAPPPSAPTAKLSKRSIAIHTGYVGTGYRGSSVNRCLGDAGTIEQVLETAIHKAGFISDANYGCFSKIKWSRASRTDKGVHSLGTVMGLRMLVDDGVYQVGRDVEGIAAAEAINAHLPPEIRVFCAQKTNKKFNARHMCEGRSYEYYLPASMLELKCDGSAEDAQRLEAFRDALRCFEGANPFHNYTKMKAYGWDSTNIPYRGRGQKRPYADGASDGQASNGAAPDGAEAPPPVDAAGSVAGPVGDGDQAAQPQQAVDQQGAAAAAVAADCGAAGQGPDAKRLRTDEETAGTKPGALDGADDGGGGGDGGSGRGRGGRGRGGGGGRDGGRGGRGQRGGRGGGGGGRGGGKRKGGGSDDDDSNNDDDDGEPAGGELDDSDEEGGDAGAAGADGGGASAGGRTPGLRTPYLRWQADFTSRDKVTQTYYRKIMSFTAQDPELLVKGGQPCLLLKVEGQSFMLHHIRHMVGTAVAVALGLISKELLEASLACPARISLPRAPPHTLLLSDCSFHPFPQQFGPGNNDLDRVSGERLTLRERGRKAKEEFRKQVLAPALEHLAELDEWQQWKATLQRQYPFPQAVIEPFLEQYRAWGETMAVKRKAREERMGVVGGRGRQANEQQ